MNQEEPDGVPHLRLLHEFWIYYCKTFTHRVVPLTAINHTRNQLVLANETIQENRFTELVAQLCDKRCDD